MKVIRKVPIGLGYDITLYRRMDGLFFIETPEDASDPMPYADAIRLMDDPDLANVNRFSIDSCKRIVELIIKSDQTTTPLDDYDITPPVHNKPTRVKCKIRDNRLKPHERRKVWAKVSSASVRSKVSSNPDVKRVIGNAVFKDITQYSYPVKIVK